MDKKKVIKGLETCISVQEGDNCPKDCPYYQEVCFGYNQLMRDALALLKGEEPETDIRDIIGLWCDDIMFCQEDCERMDCPRNQRNIRDHSIPHSFSVEIPLDCPKKAVKN